AGTVMTPDRRLKNEGSDSLAGLHTIPAAVASANLEEQNQSPAGKQCLVSLGPGTVLERSFATVLQFHHRLMLQQCLGGDVVRELEGYVKSRSVGGGGGGGGGGKSRSKRRLIQRLLLLLLLLLLPFGVPAKMANNNVNIKMVVVVVWGGRKSGEKERERLAANSQIQTRAAVVSLSPCGAHSTGLCVLIACGLTPTSYIFLLVHLPVPMATSASIAIKQLQQHFQGKTGILPFLHSDVRPRCACLTFTAESRTRLQIIQEEDEGWSKLKLVVMDQ
ncbi:hypothetical protein INR49_022096, partial [Caranx melampygus]